MSIHKNASEFENHRPATEWQDGAAAHAHRVAEQHGKQDHLTGPEQSRQAQEHSEDAHQHTQAATTHGIALFGHAEIAALAFERWQQRGCPEGSPQEDWFHAAEQLRSRISSR
jgi:hypothetical protein